MVMEITSHTSPYLEAQIISLAAGEIRSLDVLVAGQARAGTERPCGPELRVLAVSLQGIFLPVLRHSLGTQGSQKPSILAKREWCSVTYRQT